VADRRYRREREKGTLAVEPEDVAAYVDAAAALLDLPIDAAHRPAVIAHLAGLLAGARLFTEFAIPDDVEPAPVFRP